MTDGRLAVSVVWWAPAGLEETGKYLWGRKRVVRPEQSIVVASRMPAM